MINNSKSNFKILANESNQSVTNVKWRYMLVAAENGIRTEN